MLYFSSMTTHRTLINLYANELKPGDRIPALGVTVAGLPALAVHDSNREIHVLVEEYNHQGVRDQWELVTRANEGNTYAVARIVERAS